MLHEPATQRKTERVYRVHLKEHGPNAIYKATIATKMVFADDGTSWIRVPDESCPAVEVAAPNERLAIKRLCQAFKPDDLRKVRKASHIDVMEVGYDPEPTRRFLVENPAAGEEAFVTRDQLDRLPDGWWQIPPA